MKMKIIIAAIFLLFVIGGQLTDAQKGAAETVGKILQLPKAEEVESVEIGKESIANWFTPASLLEVLPRLVPSNRGYRTKMLYQTGTFKLKNGKVINWRAEENNFLWIYDRKSEQLFAIPTTGEVSKSAANKPETMLFRGSIYLDFFEMTLVREGKNLRGSYFRVKSGRANSIKLRGNIDADGKVILREFNSANKQTGEFRGVLGENAEDYDLYFKGNWKGSRRKSRQFDSTGQITGFTSGRRIETKYIREKNAARRFEFDASYPQIAGGNAADFSDFNLTAKRMVSKPVAEFKEMALSLTAAERKELRGSGNDFSVYSYIKFADDDLISVQNFYSESSNGMIHPLNHIETLNYDLPNKRQLKLADLFVPDAKYLEIISAYCLKELQSRPPFNGSKLADGGWADGAKPIAENYENWNLMKKGMLISFNDYQIAPYSAGMQFVIIPYSEFKNVAKPDGILAKMMK